jgi:predicted O-methyltransferase YrrM
MLKSFIKKYTPLKKLYRTIDFYKQHTKDLKNELMRYKTWVPPGHYYSPIPSVSEIQEKEDQLFKPLIVEENVVDFNSDEQLVLLNQLHEYYTEIPFSEQKHEQFRYYYDNDFFSYADGIVLYSMLRYLKPTQVIEIGSGFSSAVMLDTAELFLENATSFTFIEPYPERLLSLLNPTDMSKIHLVEQKLEDIPLSTFKILKENDILFIDSTHVSKAGSDVNYYLFDIFPVLESGVYIHIHDVFYPFEYPKQWLYEGRAWNEIYLLRAFLSYNTQFKIIYFNNYMGVKHSQTISEKLPLYMKNTGGSIWLQKL